MYIATKVTEVRRDPKIRTKHPKPFYETQVTPLGVIADEEYRKLIEDWKKMDQSGEIKRNMGVDIYKRCARITDNGAELIRSSVLDGEDYFIDCKVIWYLRKAETAEVRFV